MIRDPRMMRRGRKTKVETIVHPCMKRQQVEINEHVVRREASTQLGGQGQSLRTCLCPALSCSSSQFPPTLYIRNLPYFLIFENLIKHVYLYFNLHMNSPNSQVWYQWYSRRCIISVACIQATARGNRNTTCSKLLVGNEPRPTSKSKGKGCTI